MVFTNRIKLAIAAVDIWGLWNCESSLCLSMYWLTESNLVPLLLPFFFLFLCLCIAFHLFFEPSNEGAADNDWLFGSWNIDMNCWSEKKSRWIHSLFAFFFTRVRTAARGICNYVQTKERRRRESNPRSSVYKTDALTTKLQRRSGSAALNELDSKIITNGDATSKNMYSLHKLIDASRVRDEGSQ